MRLLKPAEAAVLLGVSRATIYRLIAEGEVPHVMVPHAGARIAESDLEEVVSRWRRRQSQHVSELPTRDWSGNILAGRAPAKVSGA